MQMPFKDVPDGAIFSVEVLGVFRPFLHRKTSCDCAIPCWEMVNGWPCFHSEDADNFPPSELVMYPAERL